MSSLSKGQNPILPGATIGVLGGGQLGRMFAMAARQMGYRVHTLSPETDTPTGQIADLEITASYTDFDVVREFAANIDVATIEFENIPSATLEFLAEHVPVRPSGQVLHTTQHRLREKSFLVEHGFPVTLFRAVRSLEDLRRGLETLGLPAILKTADWGYDGKGQRKLESLDDATAAFTELNGQPAILEAFVDFEREVSVVAARGRENQIVHYGVIENMHERHILDCSVAPSSVPPEVFRQATEIAANLLEQLDVVGVLCVELFLTRSGALYVNELAPRPHNSGHLTIDACVTSQFEQQVRAVCALPLGAPDFLRPAAAMANLLGDLWEDGEPDWAAACASSPHVKLHLYGKRTAHKGRKMGHLTALAPTTAEALRLVREARQRLIAPQSAPYT